MTIFKIDVISDTVCPWCFIGSRKLDAGISLYRRRHPERRKLDSFIVTWHPFQLNPQFTRGPASSIDKREYYKAKYGSARFARMEQMMTTAGKEVGIQFSFGGRTGNTRDSHRLIALAGKKKKNDDDEDDKNAQDEKEKKRKQEERGGGEMEGKFREEEKSMQEKVVEELFQAFFEHEGDITHPTVLLDAAVKAGLDARETREWLETDDQGGVEVDREVQQAVEAGVSGVPHFTLQGVGEVGEGGGEGGTYELSGSVDPARFVELFEAIRSD